MGIGDYSPRVSQHTAFYYAGMQFCLKGIQEQYDLRQQQLIRVSTDSQTYDEQVCYKYVEFISKIINTDSKILMLVTKK